MEDIRVGENIRTRYGEIGKYLGIDTKFEMYDYDVNGNRSSCNYNELVKHSQNIIDLIEVGDYVNGYRVVAIMEDMETGEIHLEMTLDYTNEIKGDCTIYNDDIKSIVTHEAFESIKYEV